MTYKQTQMSPWLFILLLEGLNYIFERNNYYEEQKNIHKNADTETKPYIGWSCYPSDVRGAGYAA